MSGGLSCKCGEATKPVDQRSWRVVDYKCNYSKFNGSHYTPSDYSAIRCHACLAFWRTKADYVDQLQHGDVK